MVVGPAKILERLQKNKIPSRKTVVGLSIFRDSLQKVRKIIPKKIDQISIEELDIIYKVPHCVPLSAHHKWNFDEIVNVFIVVQRKFWPVGTPYYYFQPVMMSINHWWIKSA